MPTANIKLNYKIRILKFLKIAICLPLLAFIIKNSIMQTGQLLISVTLETFSQNIGFGLLVTFISLILFFYFIIMALMVPYFYFIVDFMRITGEIGEEDQQYEYTYALITFISGLSLNLLYLYYYPSSDSFMNALVWTQIIPLGVLGSTSSIALTETKALKRISTKVLFTLVFTGLFYIYIYYNFESLKNNYINNELKYISSVIVSYPVFLLISYLIALLSNMKINLISKSLINSIGKCTKKYNLEFISKSRVLSFLINIILKPILINRKIRRAVAASIIAMCLFFVTASILIASLDVSALSSNLYPNTVLIKSRNNEKIILYNYKTYQAKANTKLDQISHYITDALIAKEDKRFYKHFGVDLLGMLRVIAFLGKSGGGSTITQQLARTLFLDRDISFIRKLNEALYALVIERHFSKKQILEMYLNEVFWGHCIYDIGSASKFYFDKNPNELNLAESAMLVGLLPSPNNYSPYNNFEAAKKQQKIVLKLMLVNGNINQKQYDAALKFDLKNGFLKRKSSLTELCRPKIPYPFFVSYILEIIQLQYNKEISKRGLEVTSTINLKNQINAEKTIKNAPYSLSHTDINEAALVSIDAQTGQILSLVGGANFYQSQYNKITQAKRSLASTIKPFIYLTAFKDGVLAPNSIVFDEPTQWPKNYSGKNYGQITINFALTHSINTIAVKILDMVGIPKIIDTLNQVGIDTPEQLNRTLALGVIDVNPLKLAHAYTIFPNGGTMPEKLTPLILVRDNTGKTLYFNENSKQKRIFSEKNIKMINECLENVVLNGTGQQAKVPFKVGGKTGTSSGYRDAWFVGFTFTDKIVTLVWIGNSENIKMNNVTGGHSAILWGNYTRKTQNK